MKGAAWYSRNIEIPADWKEKAYRVVSGTSSDNRVDDGREVVNAPWWNLITLTSLGFT